MAALVGTLAKVPEIGEIEARVSLNWGSNTLSHARNRIFRGIPPLYSRQSAPEWALEPMSGYNMPDHQESGNRAAGGAQGSPVRHLARVFEKVTTHWWSAKSHQRVAVLRESRSAQRPDPRAVRNLPHRMREHVLCGNVGGCAHGSDRAPMPPISKTSRRSGRGGWAGARRRRGTIQHSGSRSAGWGTSGG